MKLNKFFCLLLLLSLTNLNLYSQADLEYKMIANYYPGHNVVFIKNSEDVKIDIIKGRLSITSERYQERMLTDNRAGIFSDESIDFSNLEKITKIEAGTFIAHNDKYQEVKVKDFSIKDKISKSVFYDGYKSILFTYPSLQAKCKTFVRYTSEIFEPRLFGTFFFQQNVPTIDAEFKITVSNDVELDWRLFHCNDTSLVFTKSINKNNTVYSWKMHNSNEYYLEDGAPGPLYSIPHIRVWVKSYKINGIKTNLLGTPTDLYKWYYSLTKDVNKDPGPELQSLVDSLTSGITNEFDKVKKIYYWVQDNIKYIAFEDGMGGFIPRSGKMVCERRYGDCKDMASIIYSMLACAKIPSHLTWIGSRSIPYTYNELPTPGVDNHMINTYINNGNYYFLDATGQNTPIDLPTSFIQGKEALIGIDSVTFEIIKVPEISYERNQLIDSVEIFIDKNKLNGKGVSFLSGFYHIRMMEILGGNAKETIRSLREYYNKGSNKFLIDSIQIKNLKDRDKILEIDYDFNIEDYVRYNGEDIYINLSLDKDFQTAHIDSKRKMDLEKRFKHLATTVVKLKIPKGFKVDYIPQNASFKNDKFSFSIEYTQNGKYIIQTKKIIINTLMVKNKDFEEWNKMIKDLKKAYSEALILKKI